MANSFYIEAYPGTDRLVLFNTCLMPKDVKEKFVTCYYKATESGGVDPVCFVNTWNEYAKTIQEHVFIKIPEARL